MAKKRHQAGNRATEQRPGGVSGHPAKRADEQRSLKQQRAERQQAAAAQQRAELSRRQRTKTVWWAVGISAAVLVVGGVIASIVFTPRPPSYESGGTGSEIDGVETFEHETLHVEGTVEYDQTPPAGGPHNAAWLNCGIYTEPQQNELAVHSLEHGAVWLTYDPDLVQGDDVERLVALMPKTYAILSPFPGMDTAVAVTAWDRQLRVDDVTDARLAAFFGEFWRSPDVPEPGAPCTGAVDGPGLRR